MSKKISYFANALVIISFLVIIVVGLDIKPFLIFPSSNEQLGTRINSVLLNLSYSYITGFLVYLLTTLFPHVTNKKKIEPVIDKKYNIIKGKLEDSIKCVFPMNEWSQLELTRELTVEQFSKKSLTDNCSYEVAKVARTIIKHLCGQRDDIKSIIMELIEYRDYLSGGSIVYLEKIRNSDYFIALNAYKQFTDLNEETKRGELGALLYDLYNELNNYALVLE